MITPAQLRRIILGQEGPWADPRYATDTIDNLAELVRDLDEGGRHEMVLGLAELLRDPERIVQTGAVMGLRLLRKDIDAAWYFAVIEAAKEHLDVPPLGFAGAWLPTILGEALDVVPPLPPPPPEPPAR